jgi:hypothetical protein
MTPYSVKLLTELVNALFNAQDGAQLVFLCDQQLRLPSKHGGAKQQGVVALVTQALTRHLGEQQSLEDTVVLSPLLRACETLGKFLVHRYLRMEPLAPDSCSKR